MNLPVQTLNDLAVFIAENGYPSELTISCEDFNRINDKLNPVERARTPGMMMLGVTRVKAKVGPPLDVSDRQVIAAFGER